MDEMADKFQDQGVGSYFLYTHEAHPGELVPHHTSLEQKFSQARKLRDVYQVERQILVDALDGACHRAYGSMPNMTWIFNRAGIPVYKADWTDHHSVENAVRYFLDAQLRRENREPLAPFNVQRLDYRTSDREAFYEGLKRAGPKALREFKENVRDIK